MSIPVTAEFFGTPVEIIDHAGQRWLTAEQAGLCLGYAEVNAGEGVRKLYNRHGDEFTAADACRVNLSRQGQGREMLIFSASGCILLGFFSATPRAKEFRAWAKLTLTGPTAAALPAPFRRPHGRPPRITRRVEFDVLILFADGMTQSEIARARGISAATVNLLIHGRYRFSPDAGRDITTAALREAVAERMVARDREQLTRKYFASAANQQLAQELEDAGRQLLIN